MKATDSLATSTSVTDRRDALRLGVSLLLSAGALSTVGAFALAAEPAGQPLPPVEADNATAKALGYVEDASKVDTAKYKQYKADQVCNNCKLVQGKAGDARRPCQLFPGKSVAAKGWCAGWVKQA
jgi:hypothetical protein